MEETIIKCDNCLDVLTNEEIYIELRLKDKRKVIDRKLHLCNMNCLREFLRKREGGE